MKLLWGHVRWILCAMLCGHMHCCNRHVSLVRTVDGEEAERQADTRRKNRGSMWAQETKQEHVFACAHLNLCLDGWWMVVVRAFLCECVCLWKRGARRMPYAFYIRARVFIYTRRLDRPHSQPAVVVSSETRMALAQGYVRFSSMLTQAPARQTQRCLCTLLTGKARQRTEKNNPRGGQGERRELSPGRPRRELPPPCPWSLRRLHSWLLLHAEIEQLVTSLHHRPTKFCGPHLSWGANICPVACTARKSSC